MKRKSKFIFSVFILFCCTGLLAGCGSQCSINGCENEKINKSDYCEEHTCKVEDCYEQIGSNVNYCAEHGCSVENCTELKISNSDFCEKHTCKVEGCRFVAITDSNYCIEHNCSISGCASPKESGSDYCGKHLEEQQQLEKERKQAEEKARKEQEQIKKAALSKLRTEYDKVEQITWYYPQCAPKYIDQNAFFLYMGEKEGSPWLRWRMVYSGEDWIFFDQIIISVDGENYTKTFDYSDVTRDNDYKVWEYVDISPTSSDREIIEKIITSKETIVRFDGEYRFDKTVTQNEKYGLQDILTAYDLLLE